MPRPSSGQISLGQVRTDLSASGEINMDDADVRALTFNSNILPLGSMIRMSDLYYVAASYAVTPSTTSVSEGGSVTFTVSAPNVVNGTVLYWTNAGTSSGGDFGNTSGFNNGNLTINSGTGAFTLTIANDFFEEASETIIIQIRTGSTGGPVVATAATVTIGSTSVQYNIEPDTLTVNEGGSVVYDITTTNVPDNFVLYWTISGSVEAADFTDNTLSGSVVVEVPGFPSSTTGFASVTRTLVNDATTDGEEVMIFELREVSIADPIVAQAPQVTVVDTSTGVVTPTYSLTPNVNSVNEGETVTYTVDTENVAPGTTLYWNNAGTTTAADFTDDVDQGTVVLGGTLAAGTATFTRTLKNDVLTEGLQNIAMRLRKNGFAGSAGSQIVATAATVNVEDTSTGVVAPTYAISGTPTTVNESGTVTFTVTTTNVANATVLDWVNIGTTIAADFVDNQNGGTVTINNNSGTITRALKADSLTEGSETIRLELFYQGSAVGAESNDITVTDSSVAAVTYAVTPTLTTITEGQTVTFNVTTTGVANGTVLSWTRNTTSTANNGDFSTASSPPALRGTVTINNNSGSFTVTPILDDRLTESTETLIVDLRTGGYSGTIVADTVANPVNILNSTFSLSASSTTIAEGQIVTFTVNTTNVANATNLYWTVGTGSTITLGPGGDITPQSGQGTITINSNTATFQITAVSDGVAESLETMIIDLRIRGYTGPIVDTETVSIVSGIYIDCASSTALVPGGLGIGGGTVISGYYNYNGTVIGSILGSNEIEGREIIGLFKQETTAPPLGGGGSNIYLILALNGQQIDFDWVSISVGGQTYTRTSAEDPVGYYDVTGDWTRWYWNVTSSGSLNPACGEVTYVIQEEPLNNILVSSAGSAVPQVYSELRLTNDGRTLEIKQNNTAGTPYPLGWYTPTTTDIGSSYEVSWNWVPSTPAQARTFFTMPTPNENVWISLSNFKFFRNSRINQGESEGTFRVFIRPTAGGPAVYYARVTLISNFTA